MSEEKQYRKAAERIERSIMKQLEKVEEKNGKA